MTGPASPTGPGRFEAIVHGRVQGVGFRLFTVGVARGLGLTGWVTNEPGRRVHCVAEGDRAGLDRLLLLLHEGPPGAFVERVDVAWQEPTGAFSQFEVRSGSHSGD